jgi:hypothetical protein
MHDWILLTILFDWKPRLVTLSLRNHQAGEVHLVAKDVVDLSVPHRRDWGPSVHVNEVMGAIEDGNGMQRLEIEMQSGDIIKIVAGAFHLPRISEA